MKLQLLNLVTKSNNTIKLAFIILFICLSTLYSCKSVPAEEKTLYTHFINQQKNFSTTHGNIKYIDQGKSNKVILLLHGVPCSSWLYRKMIPQLVQKGYRVIAPDMLGYGNSDNPKGYDVYNNSSHAKRILDLMDHLKIEHWHHVMHDAGGLWTWEIFKQAPDKIQKLTVLNSIVYPEGFFPPIRMKKGWFAKTAMWMYHNNITTNKMLNMFYEEALNKKSLLNEQEKWGYKKPLLQKKTRGMYYFFTQTCNDLPDYSSIFENINIPVQFIWGKNDEILQITPQLEHIKKGFKITNENIHLLDTKHLLQEEKPAEITALIHALSLNADLD